MNESWFNPMWSFLPGTLLGGIGGPLVGLVGGTLVSQGKGKMLVLGLCAALVCVSAFLLVAGIVALSSGQPYAIWYALVLPGVLGTALFGGAWFGFLQRYRQAELRKMQARNL